MLLKLVMGEYQHVCIGVERTRTYGLREVGTFDRDVTGAAERPLRMVVASGTLAMVRSQARDDNSRLTLRAPFFNAVRASLLPHFLRPQSIQIRAP